MKKKLLAGAFVVLGSVGVLAGAASAGEITGPVGNGNGNGATPAHRTTPINPDGDHHTEDGVAASICAFSGLNDEYVMGQTGVPQTQTPAEVAGTGITGLACRGSAPR